MSVAGNASPTRDPRLGFATRIGFVLAAVGSAVGLGNVWRFPYVAGENGGAAFIFIYLLCVAFVALPVLIGEFAIGRRGQRSAVGSFRVISPGTPWWLTGLLGVATAFVILSFYSAVAGWVLHYAMVGAFSGFGEYTREESGAFFGAFIEGFGQPVFYQLLAVLATVGVIVFGVHGGIERVSKVLMPALFFVMLLLILRSLTLPGAAEGIVWLFRPDFGEIGLGSVFDALGMAFFSLSVGMGAMITYASYVSRESNLVTTGTTVAGLDTAVAILAGLMIFPAVFAFGMDPAGGPGLVFVTLPSIFSEMPAGRLVGTAFFAMLFVAALTSMISILEPVVTCLVDEWSVRRGPATTISGLAILVLGIPACLSVSPGAPLGQIMIPFFGGSLGIFDLMDTLSNKLMLPIGGLLMCLFLAFSWKSRGALAEVAGTGGNPDSIWLRGWFWMAVTVAPLGIVIILVTGLLDLVR